MFNAAWTNEPQQTVGQRKQQKVRECTATTASRRSSRSGESNTPQPRPSAFTLPSVGTRDAVPWSRAATQGKQIERRLSSYTIKSHTSHPDHPDAGAAPVNRRKETDHDFFAIGYTGWGHSEVSESLFSDQTGLSEDSETSYDSGFQSISKSQVVQPLSPSSFVTRKTEVTVSSSSSIKVSEQYAAAVRISAENCHIEALGSPNKNVLFSAFHSPDDNALRREAASSNIWPSRNAEVWHPPDAWRCTPEAATLKDSLGAPFPTSTFSKDKQNSVTPPCELTHLQRSIRRMEAASPKIALERLKEEWMEVEDASDYRELELEKQLWMLSALRTLNRLKVVEAPGAAPVGQKPTSSAKALSLYESHASASFLSALLPHVEIHHISTSPLSPNNHPNIHPIEVPNPAPQLPYASKIFTSIHGFTIPALLPASSIPALLRECHRTLMSNSSVTPSFIPPVPQQNGTLHLTLLDPAPLPATLGPRLRAWLDDHLLLNLEKQFRCINPMRLFPLWLADSGLRAQGSTITSVRFLASVTSSLRSGREPSGHGVRQELKSILGRMLWKEMWGGFVDAEKWWWEDERVVEECERLGTVWEYAIVEAVREG